MKPLEPMHTDRWWPESLGESPNSAGGQNEMRYAYFAGKKCLAVDAGGGQISIYDTGTHRISRVQQDQSSAGKKLVVTSEDGEVDPDDLKQVTA